MEFNILNDDIKYYLLSKCSIISILKLYNANNSFISVEMLNNIINNKWTINIGKQIGRSILFHEYLNFDKKVSIYKIKTISNCTIWATNSIINLKYNNIDDKDVAINDLLICYDNIFISNNAPLPKKNTDDIGIFKRLIGDGEAFDLNILAYINIYNIYEMFKASITFGKMSVFKEKLKDNIISNFDRSPLSSSLRSKIPSYILEKIDDNKRVSLLNLNKNEFGLKYLHLLNNIFDNCVDGKYFKFKVYIAIQICKFIWVFKENLGKDHPAIIAAIDKMRAFNNLLGIKIINIPEYLHFYATFEISYILSKLAY